MEPAAATRTEVTVKLSLTPEEEQMLLWCVTEKGQDVAGYLHTLVEEDLRRPPALSEILAPIHEEFRQSGMTEDELSALIDEAREEVWQEKQRGKAAP